MNLNNEELKRLLEEDNSSPIEQADVETFSRILSMLKEEDKEVQLSANFSARVIQKIEQKQKQENQFSWFGYLAGVIGLVLSLIISLALVDFKIDLGFLKGISSYSGLFLFGIAFILTLHVLEKKFIRISSE